MTPSLLFINYKNTPPPKSITIVKYLDYIKLKTNKPEVVSFINIYSKQWNQTQFFYYCSPSSFFKR